MAGSFIKTSGLRKLM